MSQRKSRLIYFATSKNKWLEVGYGWGWCCVMVGWGSAYHLGEVMQILFYLHIIKKVYLVSLTKHRAQTI